MVQASPEISRVCPACGKIVVVRAQNVNLKVALKDVEIQRALRQHVENPQDCVAPTEERQSVLNIIYDAQFHP